MKKNIHVLTLILTMIFLFSLLGCGKVTGEGKAVNVSELFNGVWNLYSDDEKFPVAGGDFDHANMEAPDIFDIVANKEAFTATYLVSGEMLADIDGEVVTLQHMMNTNTFCAAMFNISDSSKISSYAEEYKKIVQGNQWMCGMPDTVVVMAVDNAMIISYGEDETVRDFMNKCTSYDPNITVIINAPAWEE